VAATGKTPILLYGSTTATNTPSAGNLTNSSDGCEIAINVADKNLFFKDSTNVVNTVPIRQSSASSDGWLSSTDWSTFNSKQPAGSYLTSVTVDSPLTGAGTSASHLSIPAANGSTNGYLTSTDWTTFNNKASTSSPTFTGDVTLSTGNLVIGTSGKGIDFSATAGTGTSELLADYEEGTWTPAYTPTGTGFTSITYASQVGYYTKVGRAVTIRCFIRTSAITIGSASGTMQITGLPYTVASGMGGTGIAAGTFNWAGNVPISGSSFSNAISLYYRTTVNGRDYDLAPSDLATGASSNDIYFSCTYFV